MVWQRDSYTWRALRLDDLDALNALDMACQQTDGEVSVPTPAYRYLLDRPDVQTLCAIAPHDQVTRHGHNNPIVAVGWIQPGETQTQLRGKVHPLHRRLGLGTYLLRWLEEQATHLRQPTTLIIRNEALNDGSVALYEQQGYRCDFVENWMERDLSHSLPTLADTFVHTQWTTTNAYQFFEVYCDAFKERPGFRISAVDDWIAEYADDPDFRPDLSLLALVEDDPVGFVTSGTNPIPTRTAPVGWISQIGVRPAWRRHNVAAGLITAVIRAFRSEELTAIGLHVNVNNSGAIRVYEQLGFNVIGQRAKYSKNR